MSVVIDHKQINKQPLQNNANSLINGQKAGKGHNSFANELAMMRESAGQARSEANPMAQEDVQVLKQGATASTTEKQTTATMPGFAQALNQDAETQLKNLRNQELNKEMVQTQTTEESQKEAQELSNKFGNSEALNANVGQVNNKQVTEALREGNVAQQEANYQDSSNERKKQLANWEELAPSIIEDPTNKAIRLDIPGIEDLETLIVRMNKGSVGIQVIGSKGAMEQLISNESELAKRLGAKSIGLDKFQVFDGDVLRKSKAKAAA
ncbi:MAG: hypothetical protein HOA17_00880 [Candidatus Melainabacteria bacterium]|nr:hypothetical protein [Candidatus Melainabacteria bacterium]